MGSKLILPTIQILSAALTEGHVMGSVRAETNWIRLASSGCIGLLMGMFFSNLITFSRLWHSCLIQN